MKKGTFLALFLTYSVFLLGQLPGQSLPFDSLLNKTHKENRENFAVLYSNTMAMDSARALAYMDSLRIFSVRYRNEELKLEADFIKASYCYIRKISCCADKNQDECYLEQFKDILDEAQTHKIVQMQMRTCYWTGLVA